MSSYNNLTEEDLKQIVKDSHSWSDVISKCGLKTITRSLQRKLAKYNIDSSHFEKRFDGKYTKINKLTKEQITDIVAKNDKWMDIMKAFRYTSCAHVRYIQAKLVNLGINFDHVDQEYDPPKNLIPLADVLVNDSTYNNMSKLRLRLQRELGWEHRCVVCNNTEWNGRAIPIQIDHINGDHYDNRIENLRFLCPNCHAQTDTYCGKNMKICKENKLKLEAQPKDKPKKTKENQSKHTCIDCNKGLKSKATRCKECDESNRINLRKVERPSHEQLIDDLQEMSMVKVGKKYGVSDNCIRKWMNQYTKNVQQTQIN